MYLNHFGLTQAPFSIAPNHRVLYMSHNHREAVAHLLYALQEEGGFVQLTGEVGTGKTTLCRYLLANLPDNVDVALLLNPRINELELLEMICDELHIGYSPVPTVKELLNLINRHLLEAYSNGRRTVVIVDEAQNLSREVLEQIRLLTNLETTRHKLMQIILIGQPELAEMLERRDLRQLAQRITGRFHLGTLSAKESREYIQYRLAAAGGREDLFTKPAMRRAHRLSGGTPRLINVICDRALLGAFSRDKRRVTRNIVKVAGSEVLGGRRRGRGRLGRVLAVLLLLALVPFLWRYYTLHFGKQGAMTGTPPLAAEEHLTPPLAEAGLAGAPMTDAGARPPKEVEQPAEAQTSLQPDLSMRLGVPMQREPDAQETR